MPETSPPRSSSHRSSRNKEDRSHRHRHRHHRDQDRDRDRDSRHHHRRKRSRHRDDDDHDSRRHHKSRKTASPDKGKEGNNDDGEWIEAPAEDIAPAPAPSEPSAKRDAWMMEPSADAIEYTNRGHKAPPPKTTAQPDYRPAIHKNELNAQLVAGKSLDEYAADEVQVSYTFGDEGSKWRMAKLKRVYEFAEEEGRSVDDVAMQRYGDLKLFDEAREEEVELGRREMYGTDRRDAKERPTGELHEERMEKSAAAVRARDERNEELPQGQIMETVHANNAAPVDQTALNRMRAALMKAQMKGDPKAAQLEKEYNDAMEASKKGANVVVLSAMDSRQLAGLGDRVGKQVLEGKKGKLIENNDMTIEDMVREEKRTKGQGEGKAFAERISRDAKFTDDLDYMDENAARLAQRIQKNEIDIKNMAINEFKKMQRVLDTCPLCEHDDKPPLAPVVSLATRVFLTLPTEPELARGGAMIVPIQHRTNMMECDDDEWEEVRNFMKSLTRLYASQQRTVVFYENAASPAARRHAGITAIPLPGDLGDTAPAYFREAILSSDEEWAQHNKLLDTTNKGKMGFRRTMVKEMPYFHAWFTIDGGVGHVIEDERRWPKGDLFAREVLGGMLDLEHTVWKRQGRWRGAAGEKQRVEEFRKGWKDFDWTSVLYD